MQHSLVLKMVDGFSAYSVSNRGDVFRAGKKLRLQHDTNGYLSACLSKNGVVKRMRVHRLVAMAFIKNENNKPEVNHLDGNRKNNGIDNLEWVTKSENTLHAYHVTKSMVPPRSMAGRFGDRHNKSKKFRIEFPNGTFREYGSGLEFTRETGLDHTAISWARINKGSGYKFTRGGCRGLTVHFD